MNAAKKEGVRHLVYTSVASADKKTGIPHFDSKREIEQQIAKADVPFTTIGPVYFMENLLFPSSLDALRQGKYAAALPPRRNIQQVAVQDIGRFAALVFERRVEFLGKRVDIASDELSGSEMAKILSRISGQILEYTQLPLSAVRAQSEDMATMYAWFDRVGYDAPIGKLRREYPEVGWHTFEDWATQQDWSVLAESRK